MVLKLGDDGAVVFEWTIDIEFSIKFIVEDIPVPSAFNSLFTIPLHTEQP